MAKGKKQKLTARTADRHDLYEQSVQDTEGDLEIIDRAYRREHGKLPQSLREDFCGTALLCAEWVKSRPTRTAVGIDLDRKTLDYAAKHRIEPLGDAAARVQLVRANVLEVGGAQVDVIAAFNFSYCVFFERRDLLRYFEAAHKSLSPGGALFLDNHSGPEAFEDLIEPRRCKGFTYVWEQKPLNAITNRSKRYIHFRFPDGTELKRAFRYDWRIWTVPELRDLLEEAGFRRTDIYCEDFDDDESSNGFRRVKKITHDQSWIPYLVAWK